MDLQFKLKRHKFGLSSKDSAIIQIRLDFVKKLYNPLIPQIDTLYYQVLPYRVNIFRSIFNESNDLIHSPIPSSWQSFCGATELFLLASSSLCHTLVASHLYYGQIERDSYLHYVLLCAPLGLLLGIIGCSLSAAVYGISSSIFVIAVTWNQLPFSQ